MSDGFVAQAGGGDRHEREPAEAVMLHWTEYPVPVPGMIVWGAHDERYQYIVSFDSKFGTWGASAKKLGHGHLIGRKLIELGAKHRTREAALAAVEQHRRAITNERRI